MPKIELGQFNDYDSDVKLDMFLKSNIDDGDLWGLYKLRDRIKSIYDCNPEQEYPDWFIESYNAILNRFTNYIKAARNKQPDLNYPNLDKLVAVLYNKALDPYSQINFSIPFLENYSRNLQLQNGLNSIIESKDRSYNELKNQNKAEFEKIKIEFDTSLSLLNKEVGKLGVKNYAEIFQLQAYEHSSSNKKILDENQKEIKHGIGKAQKWLTAGILLFVLLIIISFFINSIFSLPNKEKFTPEDMVEIIGRVLLISSLIFLISFSFKQYRVNMHLYTLNKHRANTLKSFEYLTNAPDKLAPESYNAILMEVAKAIYESGQTGYINNSDSNSEMPSIIDLTKIIHPAK